MSSETFEQVAPERWDTLLAEIGITDAYVQRAWLDSCAVIEHGKPVLLHARSDGGSIILAVLLRDIPDEPGWHDVVTPYGYGGPLVVGDDPPVDAFRVGRAEWLREQQVVSVFTRFHPLYANEGLAPRRMKLTELAGTIAWNVEAGRDLEASMHARHRRAVRTARRDGVTVEVTSLPAAIDAFLPLYEETMRRQNAAEFYFFPPEYWRILREGFGEQLVVAQAFLHGQLAASLLCVAAPPFLHYHLGANSDDGRRVGASNLSFLTAAQWAQERGYSRFHLGGGVGGSTDSLYDFKHRFDPELGAIPAYIGKLIVDEQKYLELAGSLSTDGFFPAYRA